MTKTNNPEAVCQKCGKPLGVSKSNRNRGQLVGCRPCWRREWYKRNQEYVKEQSAEYYARTRDRRLEVAKQTRESMSPAERKLWYRRINLKRKYGITLEDYERMFSEQNGRCFLCEAEPPAGRPLSVDHCHKEKRVRRLLCDVCNRFLGIIERDPTWVDRALLYLKGQ